MVPAIVAVGTLLGAAGIGLAAQFTDAELRSALISMTRENRCGFGRSDPTDIRQCPDYSVSIPGDGAVEYEGRNGVRTLGKRTHRTAPEAVRKLVVEFERSGFFQLKDRYEQVQEGHLIKKIDHAIATTVSISVGGKKKTVYDFYGTPEVVGYLNGGSTK